MSAVSHGSMIEVVSRITIPSCDSIFGNPEIRLLMNITGLWPWLGHQLSPGPTNFSKAYSVASNLSFWCRVKSLDNLAQVFLSYSQGDIKSTEDLFARASPLIFTEWFPKHSSLAFGHLLRLLERGPAYYQHVILLMLKVLLQQTLVDAAQSPHVYAIVSQLVECTLCWEALSVLDVLLQSCSVSSGAHMDELGFGDLVWRKRWRGCSHHRTHLKARSGPLQYMAGGQGGGDGGGGNDGGLSEREVALQNARLMLGHVLDTCALGRKRDHKRLMPFVANIGNE